jgi:hypothetical protein
MYLKPSWFLLQQFTSAVKEYNIYTKMDFLDPKKKRAHKIQLLVGYGLLAVAISLATLIMLLQVQGYGIDRKTGGVIQNGLLYVDSHPVKAGIYLNGEYKGESSKRLNLPAGDYETELKLEGYRSWKRSFNLSGGGIIRMVYPFLFPENLEPEDIQLYASPPALASQSPDRHWLLVQHPGSLLRFDLVDLSTDSGTARTINLQESLLTAGAKKNRLEAVEWSTNNRHVLLKHVFDDKVEFLVIDKDQPNNSVNLNAHFEREFDQVSLRDKRYDQYYFHNQKTGELVRAVLRSKEIVQVVAKGVKDFRPHGADMLMYVTSEGASENSVLVKILNRNNQYTLRELPTGSKYLLNMARYDGKWYLAAGTSEDRKVYIYIDPFEDLTRNQPRLPFPARLLRLDVPVEYLEFSSNTRLLSVQGASHFAVFDAEESQQYRYNTKLKLNKGQQATWMDGHRLAIVSEGSLRVFDFDGVNMHKLVDAHAQNTPFFDNGYEALFTLSPSLTIKGRTALVRTSMLVDRQ